MKRDADAHWNFGWETNSGILKSSHSRHQRNKKNQESVKIVAVTLKDDALDYNYNDKQ